MIKDVFLHSPTRPSKLLDRFLIERQNMSQTDLDSIRQQVRSHYSQVANKKSSCCRGDGCCSSKSEELKESGCATKDIETVPDNANMDSGTSNPLSIASFIEGDTVVDLGSGGGFDCFLAANQVGSSGKVIGVDMTPEMISKASLNAKKGGYKNVEFRLGEIENLPVADNSVDVIISNCVIYLSPDKQRVYHEAYRILRKGGRLAVSDIVGMGTLAEDQKNNETYCGYVSGADTIEEISKILKDAGFRDVLVELKYESKDFIKNGKPLNGGECYICTAAITACK
jgi:SAM-dependent methyltransferase